MAPLFVVSPTPIFFVLFFFQASVLEVVIGTLGNMAMTDVKYQVCSYSASALPAPLLLILPPIMFCKPPPPPHKKKKKKKKKKNKKEGKKKKTSYESV